VLQIQLTSAAVGPKLTARDLLLIGLAGIGTHFTEINVTSPASFREIANQTDFDVAARLMDALEGALGQESVQL
jgi:glutathione synthase